jgi:lipoyl(octanoyl) transferase
LLEFQDWGLVGYAEAYERQKRLVQEITTNRGRSVLVLCEHPTVITIGRNGSVDNVLFKIDYLKRIGIEIVDVDRGGDVTLHNPGQLVGYPIFDLSTYKEDLHWFLREVEQCIIELVAGYGITPSRIEGLTGVWVGGERKICAMGFHCVRWVTSHGFALNVSNDLREFGYIVPCGIQGKSVTSIEVETALKVDFEGLKAKCRFEFGKRF